MLSPRAFREQRRRGARGQALLLMVLFLLLILGIAGLAADGGHIYLSKRDVQNATDSAALAAGQRLAAETTPVKPTSSNSPPVLAANAFAANNGFVTTLSTACDGTSSNGGFTTTWVDTGSCSSLSTATTVVTVNDPPVTSPDGQLPPSQCSATNYSCLQVVIQRKVRNYIMGVFGIPTTNVLASAVVDASAGTASSLGSLPPDAAMYLYEPHSAFDASQSPSRTNLACATSCPTFWTMNDGQPMIVGLQGTEYPAMQSNGDMVIQGQTTFCDPNGGTCQPNQKIGTDGWSINSSTGSLYYCTGLNGAKPGGCTTTGQAGLDQLWGSKVSFTAESYVPPAPPTPTIDCSGFDLILNGQSVQSATTGQPCAAGASTPYTIVPAKYHSITINHGTYEFGSGVFEITGEAPVNTLGPLTGCPGSKVYLANGIDHCNETSTHDPDLCNANQSAIACPTLTAGVWIGHGGGLFTAASAGAAGTCTNGGVGDIDGGGGDQTFVTGQSVTFLLDPTSGGFVSTNEVQVINLQSPGPSSTVAPLLIDEQNSSMIHLDAGSKPGPQNYSQFNGILYQPSTVTGGGVEMNSALSSKGHGALVGQVLAYSFTSWGNGTAVNFSGGWGVGTPQIGTSGHNENSIIGTPAPGNPVASTSHPGDETFTLNYTDEWALDGYDVYIRINGANPVFFSQNEWGPQPASNASLPPEGAANSNPNDSAPSWPVPGTTTPTYPSTGLYTFSNGAASAGYNVATDPATSLNDDWTETVGSGSSASYFEIVGAWTWGHQKDISGSVSGGYTAQINYTFPTPSGSSVGITIFMTDGDHCGDYASASYTLTNAGNGSGGTPGTVELLQ
ncbi:MAG: Tad domain-containing protein [Candidatus Dormibacteria bacterium]